MTPDRTRELLGGLATGILTPEERQTLFEAALHDQALFNEVADELEFAAFLQSPETRAQLANKIEVEPVRRQWWALRPRWLALSGVLAASAVLTVVLWHRPGEEVHEVAVATAPPPVSAPPPAPPTAPAPSEPPKQTRAKPGAARAKPAIQQRKSEAAEATPSEAKPPEAEKAPVKAAPEPEQQTVSGGNLALPSPRSAGATAFRESPMRAAPVAPKPSVPAPPPPARPSSDASPPSPADVASLEGTVHDAAGTAVSNATIDIINTATHTTLHAKSDAAGRFVAPPLAPGGPYTVIASAPGFKREERAGIVLAVNQPARIDVPLQVGSVSETVQVAAAAAGVPMGTTNQVNGTRQVAVLDFVNGTSQSQSGQQAADLLASQLVGSGQVRVIDRDKVQQAQQAQAQSQSRPPSAKQAADLGRRVGADAVIVGSVQTPAAGDANVAVTAQVIDSKKARAMPKVSANATSLQSATSQVGLALESQLAMPLEGVVRRVEQNTLTVTFKAPATPRIGAQLEVYHGKRKIGVLTLTSAYQQSGAGTFSGSGQPRAGDRVATSP